MNREQDKYKAGLFVIAGMLLGVGVVFLLSDVKRFTEKQRDVEAFFTIADGLQGLKVGSTVTLGDQPVGIVAAIADATHYPPDMKMPELPVSAEAASQPSITVVGVIVTIRIPQRYDIYRDASFEVVAPPLGNGTKLNIRSVGADIAHPYTPGHPIHGSLAPSVLTENFTRNLGIRDLQRQQIQEIIANVDLITKGLTVKPSEMPPGTKPIPAQMMIDHLDEASDQIRKDVPHLFTQLDEALADLKSTTKDAKDVLAQIKEHSPQWIGKVDDTLSNARQSTQRIDKFLEDNDPKLRAIVDDAQVVAHDIREKTMIQVTQSLDKANTTLDNFNALGSECRNLISSQRPVLEKALANAKVAAEQFKLASMEIRRSPWRLLYTPTTQELEADNLYDAARSYMIVASEVDSAAVTLRAMAADPNADKAKVQAMLDSLEKDMAKYKEAEDRFWKALGKK